MYQVGLMDTDKHIQYFWRALESFSQVRRVVDFIRNICKFTNYFRTNYDDLLSLLVIKSEYPWDSHAVHHQTFIFHHFQ